MASTTGNNNDGGVHAATSHNLSTTKATVDTDLSNISQFIFLEAGRNHKNGGKSDFSYESSLDIMTVQNNEDLKDDFSEFINIPSLVSDDEDIESSVMNKESSHGWKNKDLCNQPLLPFQVIYPNVEHHQRNNNNNNNN